MLQSDIPMWHPSQYKHPLVDWESKTSEELERKEQKQFEMRRIGKVYALYKNYIVPYKETNLTQMYEALTIIIKHFYSNENII
jgi:hypothetical protein